MKLFLLLATISLSLLLYQVSLLVNVDIPQMSSQTRIAELETMLLNEISTKNILRERLQEVLETQQKTAVMTTQNDGMETYDRGNKQKDSKLAAAKLPHGSLVARDAIVVTAYYVDDCLASRLRHLVESSQSSIKGVQRDVWVIHSHYKFDERYQDGNNKTFAQQFSRPQYLYSDEEFPITSKNAKLMHSQKLIASIPGLHSASQSVLGDAMFDWEVGSSKSSFLKLIAQYGYRFGWLVEDDLFYTGPWGVLFDAFDTDANQGEGAFSSTADVLSVNHFQNSQESFWKWPGRRNCFVDTGHDDWPDSIRRCKEVEPTQTGWMLIRLSEGFASSLLRDLEPRRRSATGHHEAIVGAYSKIHNFTLQNIPQEHIGRMEFGGWGKWVELPHNQTSRLEHHGPIHRNKLYHPVKCSAYPPGWIDKDLEKWTAATTIR